MQRESRLGDGLDPFRGAPKWIRALESGLLAILGLGFLVGFVSLFGALPNALLKAASYGFFGSMFGYLIMLYIYRINQKEAGFRAAYKDALNALASEIKGANALFDASQARESQMRRADEFATSTFRLDQLQREIARLEQEIDDRGKQILSMSVKLGEVEVVLDRNLREFEGRANRSALRFFLLGLLSSIPIGIAINLFTQ